MQLLIDNLRMQFGKNLLFEASKLIFSKGDCIYLQGDNGAGKTTLMKLLAGLIKPTSGKIIWQNNTPSPWWKSRPQLGKAIYLHQHPYFFEGSVKYNLKLAGQYGRHSADERTKRVAQAIEMAGLSHLIHSNATDLSGGERQRLAIARIWVIQPQLLMLDEPVSNMDKHSQARVLEMICHLKDQGTGMLITSHQNCELTALCRHAWQIKQQRITAPPFAIGGEALQEESVNVIAN